VTNTTNQDSAAQARVALTTAYTELLAASKVAVGDDGKTLIVAAAALDLAVELLTPPNPEVAMATNSCREALELLAETRTYAQGGNIANLLDPAKKKIEAALKLLAS
jgi:hypothetical protein